MKTDQHQRYLGLCLPYAFGRLNPRNKNFFESHLKEGCELCNKELAEIYEAMSLLPLTLPQQSAPPRLKDRVLAAARTSQRPQPKQAEQRRPAERGRPERGRERQPERRAPQPAVIAPSKPAQQRPWFGYAIAFATLLIVVALGLYTNSLIDRATEHEARIAALTNDMEQQRELLAILRAQNVEMVLMSGTESVPAGYGKIVWNPAARAAIVQVANLPVNPPDNTYQLWIIQNQQPVSAGVFSVRDEREGYFNIVTLDIPDRTAIDGFTVTLEPKGGSPQPSGTMYLTAKPNP
jgi:hypothetical protein